MDYKVVKRLLEKYLEGDSSLEEEQLLQKYFREAKQVPAEFQYAKELFLHFRTESEERYQPATLRKLPNTNRKYWQKVAGIAASVLLMIAALFVYQQPKSGEKIAYAYINGKPVTNKEVAIAETKKALSLITKNLNHGTKDLKHLSKFHQIEQLISKKE